jgi:hypothetical protein
MQLLGNVKCGRRKIDFGRLSPIKMIFGNFALFWVLATPANCSLCVVSFQKKRRKEAEARTAKAEAEARRKAEENELKRKEAVLLVRQLQQLHGDRMCFHSFFAVSVSFFPQLFLCISRLFALVFCLPNPSLYVLHCCPGAAATTTTGPHVGAFSSLVISLFFTVYYSSLLGLSPSSPVLYCFDALLSVC